MHSVTTSLQHAGHLTGCGGAKPHHTAKSATTTSWDHFCIILKNYQKLWTMILLKSSFNTKMELISYHNFSSLK